MNVSISNNSKFCIESEPGDSKYFGSSSSYGGGVAINDRYIVVTDPGNNRVIVYQKNVRDIWQRTREIYPPRNSIYSKLGHSFSHELKLNQHGLIIKTRNIVISKDIEKQLFLEYFNERINSQQYYVELDKTEELFLLPIAERRNLFQFYYLYKGRLRIITLKTKIIVDKRRISTYKNLILIGLPSRSTCGKGLLFDLEALDKSPIELKADNAFIGDTVAISKEFAIVRNNYSHLSSRSNKDGTCLAKTLIISLKNSSFFVLNRTGYVSLYKNILAVRRPRSRIAMQSAKLSLYFINKNASPRIFMERYGVGKAWIENGWLITFEKSKKTTKETSRICFEPLQKLAIN